jgi:endonuclease/exonuclease/phosphatase family metal-dependent hydrolase
MTLNLWNREGPWEARQRLVRAEIERRAPDVVGLQEVLALETEDGVVETQAEQILAGLGYEFAWAKGHDLSLGLMFGNALASRFPIMASESLPLPGGEVSDQRRVLLHAMLDTPFGALPVFVTHLNWKHQEGAVRLMQVRHIVDAIDARAPRGAPTLAPILMGDMNADPESDEIRFLRGHATVDGRSECFIDTWAWAGDGSAGHTVHPRNHYYARFAEPARRIDYIFVRLETSDARGKPTSCAIVCDEEVDGVFPSDHFGLLAEIRVDG